MKFWTIQSKNVIETIHKEGKYQPDFKCSRYLNTNNGLGGLYSMLLKSFNTLNEKDLPGVIYAFARRDGDRICSIETIDEFKAFIKNNKAVIWGFWESLNKDDSVIIELNYKEDFNPIFIDINDFQFLMPPIKLFYPYTDQSENRIFNNIKTGQFTSSELPTNVIQAHLPYIEEENMLNSYPVFQLN